MAQGDLLPDGSFDMTLDPINQKDRDKLHSDAAERDFRQSVCDLVMNGAYTEAIDSLKERIKEVKKNGQSK